MESYVIPFLKNYAVDIVGFLYIKNLLDKHNNNIAKMIYSINNKYDYEQTCKLLKILNPSISLIVMYNVKKNIDNNISAFLKSNTINLENILIKHN